MLNVIQEESMEATPTEDQSERQHKEPVEDEVPEPHICWRCALKNVYGVKGFKILNCEHAYKGGFLMLLASLGATKGRLLEIV